MQYRVKKNLTRFNKFIRKYRDSETLTASSTTSRSGRLLKLPIIQLKKFDGTPENWQAFLENFECAIDLNEELSEIQKMTYLRSLLEDQAAATITGLQLTGDNYKVAMKLLKDRYDNKQLLISSHMKNLLSLEKVSDIKNIEPMRRVYDRIEIQVRSLENLGIDPEMYGPLLIPVLLAKVPEELNLIISRKFNEKECWDIKLVLEAVKTEIQVREKTVFNSESSNTRYQPITAETFHTGTEFPTKCTFCARGHKPQNCKTVVNLKERTKILREKRLCFICFWPFSQRLFFYYKMFYLW